MKLILSYIGLVPALFLQSATAGAAVADGQQFWSEWRGPLGTGAAPLADPPLTWSETNHLKWKTRIPGSGNSTPIVWGDRVFILTAIATGKKPETKPAEPQAVSRAVSPNQASQSGGAADLKAPEDIHQFVVLCYDRQTGKLLWQKIAREAVPYEGHHMDNGYATASPVTDGQHLLAYFGSYGLHCYDLEGNHKWSKDFGPAQTRRSFGEGSSPALHGNTVVIYRDDESDNDFITALDKRTGAELWRKPRNDDSGWSTPLAIEFGGKTQVVVNAAKKVISYDLATGQEIWSCAGQTRNAIPSPVASDDTVYVTSGFQGSALFAIALGRTGDLTGTDAVRWTHKKNTPYAPSPLLADAFLYTITLNNGVLSCFDAKTGAVHFEGQPLDGIKGIYASPVAAKDRVYVLGRNGTCLVLKKGPKLEILARNKLDDKTTASMALVGQELFVRGEQFLYCIGD